MVVGAHRTVASTDATMEALAELSGGGDTVILRPMVRSV
jgi:hypothetical protein